MLVAEYSIECKECGRFKLTKIDNVGIISRSKDEPKFCPICGEKINYEYKGLTACIVGRSSKNTTPKKINQ